MIRFRAPAEEGNDGDDTFEQWFGLFVTLTGGLRAGASGKDAQECAECEEDEPIPHRVNSSGHPTPPDQNTRSTNQNAPAAITTTEPVYATRSAIT